MEDSPRVSVIIATYNWSGVLRYAIESVLWQTLTDFELLVVGDGCTDDSAEVVASFRDPRVQWHNLPENSGHQSAPNNFGLARARGEFIAYLGHDDVWYPTHLAALVRALQENDAAVGYSWMEMIWGGSTGYRLISGISATGECDPSLVLPPSSLMHRRDLIDEIGSWRDYRTISAAPDTDLIARAHRAGKKFVQVKQLSVFKFAAVSRPDCYREKPSHEQAAYVARIKSEPDFLVRELSDYVELNARRHPDDIQYAGSGTGLAAGEHVRNARVIRGLEDAAIPVPHYPSPPMRRVGFESPAVDPFLWYGWSYPEDSFRWTLGETAALTFRADDERGLELIIALEPFLCPGTIEAQRVEILLNGNALAQLQLSKAELEAHRFDLSQSSLKSENVLEFLLPDATAPIKVGLNTDVRKLALRVAWMEFRSSAVV
jgi:glycosyltransferase involved in cell wall biosynthesis